MTTKEHDVTKLHCESLQLRAQQFALGTLALAGSGLSAWIAPGLTAITQEGIPQGALLGASLSWLFLLLLLYCWSLALRRTIVIITYYLQEQSYSDWEGDFRVYHKGNHKLYPSQTLFVAIAFTLYGFVAIGSSMIAARFEMGSNDRIQLDEWGYWLLGACLTIYAVVVWVLYILSRRKDPKVQIAWRTQLNPTISVSEQAVDPNT